MTKWEGNVSKLRNNLPKKRGTQSIILPTIYGSGSLRNLGGLNLC